MVSQLQGVNQVVMATGGDLHEADESEVRTIGVMLGVCVWIKTMDYSIESCYAIS